MIFQYKNGIEHCKSTLMLQKLFCNNYIYIVYVDHVSVRFAGIQKIFYYSIMNIRIYTLIDSGAALCIIYIISYVEWDKTL